LINPKSGLPRSFLAMRVALDRYWDQPGTDLVYQFSQNPDDGINKARRAVEQGFDTILISGGDGTVSTISRVLVNTDVSVGIIPSGSGNGFARHFGVPLSLGRAVAALAHATVQKIDVGVVNGLPFFVTCSMAWDAAIVRSFEKMPVRGILPYVFAGVYELFEYKPQRFDIKLDTGEEITCRDPILCTVANLSQYGGGAVIAPHAKADDGMLELIMARQKDVPSIIQAIHKFIAGSVTEIPEILFRRFKSLVLTRAHPGPSQIDGELVELPREIRISVAKHALNVLTPGKPS